MSVSGNHMYTHTHTQCACINIGGKNKSLCLLWELNLFKSLALSRINLNITPVR